MGFSLSSQGVITGTPNAAGTFPVTVTVTDDLNRSDTETFDLTIEPEVITPPPVITTPSPLPNGTQGQAYSTTLTATDGQPPLTWSGSPPAGLSLNAQGVISGTPNANGTFNFSVTVTDSGNRSDMETFDLTIDPVCVTHTVSLQGFAFDPQTLTINACDTVTWVHNDGAIPHTVTSGTDGAPGVGDLFDSSEGAPNPNDNAMGEGDTFSHTFNDVGTVPYHCRIHGVGGGTMTGTITVNPNN